ncbi:hypothetical protein [Roseobacter fucihabitans]|uniref:hypothetical protein n=1 Tax=Roseobacter fucihabitans TaxID=1537242 RepID=UPI001CA329A4|nr:hypothetical protein [Roseobacter litoralis]
MQISEDGVEIRQEGQTRKLLEHVEQVSFSGVRAARLGQPVLYVTERCVFELTQKGLKLIEIAPGIDLERDILALMDHHPIVEELRPMDARIFRNIEIDLRRNLLHLDLLERVAIESKSGQLFLNFEKMRIRTQAEIDRVKGAVAATCAAYGKPVDVIVNYDVLRIDAALGSNGAEMVAGFD